MTEVTVRRTKDSNRVRLLPNLNDRAVILSGHAVLEMKARSVTVDYVYDVLQNWENRWSSLHHRDDATPDTYVYQARELGLVVHETPSIYLVKTVLLRSPDQWNDKQARERLGATPWPDCPGPSR